MFDVISLASIKTKLLERGKTDAALKVAIFATQEFPDEHTSWYHLGEAYLHTGDRHRAIESLRRSLAIAPANPAALNLLRSAETHD